MVAQVNAPELSNVVHHDQVRVEVDDAADVGRDEVSEVDPGVVEGLVKGPPDGVADLPPDDLSIEPVDMEPEVGERGSDDSTEVVAPVGHGEEVEDDVLRAGGVLEDGEHPRDGSPKVGGVEGHCDVNG